MKLHVLNDDGSSTVHTIDQSFKTTEQLSFVSSSKKEQNALNIIKAYKSATQTILYDKTNESMQETIDKIPLQTLMQQDFSQMFFTSGSTGSPVGALKTKQNLEDEVEVFSKLVTKYAIKKVIVTVPFVHIYGTLIGLLYPLLNDIDIVLKEHFLPFNLLQSIGKNCLVVTTPLYINALNQVSESPDLKKSVFISSTAPLEAQSAKDFSEKFNTNLIQIFGSTETGGIAYKQNDEALWTPLDSVIASQNTAGELKVKSPFVSDILYENGFKTIHGEIQTFDYIEKKKEKFLLVGRSSKIFKIAGKRYSTIQIENILEEVQQINKALVFVKKHEDSLKGEVLDITLQSKLNFSSKEIKQILKSKLSNLKFSLQLHYVDKISTNAIGKKLKIN